MKGKLIKVLLVDNNPQILETVKKTLLKHYPGLIIKTSKTMKF